MKQYLSYFHAVFFVVSAILLSQGNVLTAASADSLSGVRFAYDVDFVMNFDNREYTSNDYSKSMTIFGARLTPSIGVSVFGKKTARHDVMLGIDVMKDFGASPVSPERAGTSPETSKSQDNWDLFKEITLYYRLRQQVGKTGIDLVTGIFPRRLMKGEYSTAFFSDSLRFYDNNLEGLLMSFTRPSAYYELGCDWMGQFGTDRRERFMIFSSGTASISDMFALGYSAYLYHFACARNVDGVVDNALLNPFVRFDLSHVSGLQRLSFTLGWLQSMQNDRKNIGKYTFPCGGEFTASIRNWNVGIENRLFYGTDMMPYYDRKDEAGYKYGNMLYMGDPFYRIGKRQGGAGLYDRLEVYYEPYIADFVGIRAAAVLHFNGNRFSGWQQMVSVVFNLQTLLDRKK